MITYKRRNTAFALLVGIIIFILGLIITFSGVYGRN